MNVLPSDFWLAFQVWRLSQRWAGGRKWYQHIDFGNGLTTEQRSAGDTYLRTSSFLSLLQEEDFLTQHDIVVDVGCNAGLFSLVAAQKCKQVYGVEIDRAFVRQAEFVKKFWKMNGKRVDNVTFLQGDITDNLDLVSQATVVFASKVLYHALLEDGLSKLMEAIEKGQPRLIVMQGHTVRGELGQENGMRDLVTARGFEYHLARDVPEFPVATAVRAARNYP